MDKKPPQPTLRQARILTLARTYGLSESQVLDWAVDVLWKQRGKYDFTLDVRVDFLRLSGYQEEGKT